MGDYGITRTCFAIHRRIFRTKPTTCLLKKMFLRAKFEHSATQCWGLLSIPAQNVNKETKHDVGMFFRSENRRQAPRIKILEWTKFWMIKSAWQFACSNTGELHTRGGPVYNDDNDNNNVTKKPLCSSTGLKTFESTKHCASPGPHSFQDKFTQMWCISAVMSECVTG